MLRTKVTWDTVKTPLLDIANKLAQNIFTWQHVFKNLYITGVHKTLREAVPHVNYLRSEKVSTSIEGHTHIRCAALVVASWTSYNLLPLRCASSSSAGRHVFQWEHTHIRSAAYVCMGPNSRPAVYKGACYDVEYVKHRRRKDYLNQSDNNHEAL